jgi:type IV pilus assembly protein PilC
MKKYLWKGIDRSGENKKGVSFAQSREQLTNLLLEQGVALLACKIEKESLFKKISFSKKVSLEQKVFFFSQLAVLIENGVELLKALKIVVKQLESKKFKKIVLLIIDDVASGAAFSDSLEKFPDVFSSHMIYVIRSGEHSGKIDFILRNLANYLNERLALKNKFKKAALLPFITLSFAFFIIWAVFIFVIPQFESLFTSMGKQIPASTQFVMSISNFLRSNGFLILLCIFILIVLFLRLLFQQEGMKKIKDKFVLKIYLLNKIFLLSDLISFLQSLSMFLSSGVTLGKALELSANTVQNSYLREKVFQLKEYIVQGRSFEDALTAIGPSFFPENLVAVVSVGEQTGNLDVMLQKAALFFQEDLSNSLQFILTIFQPALMIFIGLIVAFLMLAVYMPIFNMASLW